MEVDPLVFPTVEVVDELLPLTKYEPLGGDLLQRPWENPDKFVWSGTVFSQLKTEEWDLWRVPEGPLHADALRAEAYRREKFWFGVHIHANRASFKRALALALAL